MERAYGIVKVTTKQGTISKMVRFLAKTSSQKAALLLIGLALLGTIILTISFLVVGRSVELPLGIATAFFSFAAIPLFAIALKEFKEALRRAYALICMGIVLYGIGQLQFPLFEIIDGRVWIESGGVILPYILSIVCIFFGMRSFGKLVGITALWTSPLIVFGLAIVLTVAAGFMISGEQAIVMQFEIFLATVLIFSAIISERIKSITAQQYGPALTLLSASLSMLVVAALHHIVTMLTLDESSWYLSSGLTLWPAFTAAVLFALSGYAFAAFKTKALTTTDVTSPVDVIAYVASLASNPAAVEKPLDALQGASARFGAGDNHFTKEQEAELATLYIGIEDYLVGHDPLRKFTREGLHEIVRARSQLAGNRASSPFWSLFA